MKLSAHVGSLIINEFVLTDVDYNLEFTTEEFLTLLKTYPELIKTALDYLKTQGD